MNIKYFDYGCPADQSGRQYGLYQPALDLILFTIEDRDLARDLQLVMSSRYGLYLYDLTSAKNYQPELVDNACCRNWTVSNKDRVEVTHSYSISGPEITVDQLIPVIEQKKISIDLDSEQAWMHLALYWLRFLKHLQTESYRWYAVEKFVQFISDNSLPSGFGKNIETFEKMLKRSLYLRRDFELDQDIFQYIIDDEFLYPRYQKWIRK